MKFKVLLAGLLLSFQVQAASELVEKNQALAVVKNYANAIACGTSFQRDENGKIQASIKDVYIIENGVKNYLSNEFYVLWSGDQHCMGGAGTYFAQLTKVNKWTENGPYVVTGEYPFGEDVDKHINYRFISEFKQLGPNLFKITSGKFADGDPNAGPSLENTILVENQKGIGWKVISSKISKLEHETDQ